MIVALVHAALILVLLGQLVAALMGNLEEFQFGVPSAIHTVLSLMSLNLALGLFVLVFAVLQWYRGSGSIPARRMSSWRHSHGVGTSATAASLQLRRSENRKAGLGVRPMR